MKEEKKGGPGTTTIRFCSSLRNFDAKCVRRRRQNNVKNGVRFPPRRVYTHLRSVNSITDTPVFPACLLLSVFFTVWYYSVASHFCKALINIERMEVKRREKTITLFLLLLFRFALRALCRWPLFLHTTAIFKPPLILSFHVETSLHWEEVLCKLKYTPMCPSTKASPIPFCLALSLGGLWVVDFFPLSLSLFFFFNQALALLPIQRHSDYKNSSGLKWPHKQN